MPLASISSASVDGQPSINNYSESFPVIDDQACEERSGSFPDDGITSWQTFGLTNVGNPITIAPFWHRRRFRLTGYHLSFLAQMVFSEDDMWGGRWEGFFDGCPTRQLVKKEPLHDDDCSIRAEGFRENRISRGPCQKVEIRSSKNIEINPDNWNAKKIGIFPRSPTLAEKDVD